MNFGTSTGRRDRRKSLVVGLIVATSVVFGSNSPAVHAVGTPLQLTDPISLFYNPNATCTTRLNDIAVSPDGSVYMSDQALDIVGKKTGNTTAALQVVLGTSGAPGAGTDNTAATSFAIDNPQQIAFDSSGNLYVADSANNRVVKVNLAAGGDGKARVIASGFNLPGGIAAAADGTVYVADSILGGSTGSRKIWKVPYDAGTTTYGAPIAMLTGEGSKPTTAPYNDEFQKITLSPDGSTLYVVSYYGSYGSAPQNLSTLATTSPYTRQIVLTSSDLNTAFSRGYNFFGSEVVFGSDGKLHLGVSGGVIRINDLPTKAVERVGGQSGWGTAGSIAMYSGSQTFGATVTLSNTAIAFAPDGKFFYLGNCPSGVVQVSPPDVTAPSLSSTAINTAGSQLTLTYGEALSSANGPASSQFSVSVDGSPVAISSLSVSGSTVVLNLGAIVGVGSTVTVSYTDAAGNDANAIQDAAGNDAVSLVAQSVTNNSTQDLTAPVFSSAVVSSVGTQLTLTYGEALSSSNPPASSQFAVTSAGSAVAVSSLSVSGSTVVLTLGAPVELGAVVTVSYTDAAGNDANAIQDAAGNDAVSLVAQSVTNNSTATTTTTSTTTAPTTTAAPTTTTTVAATPTTLVGASNAATVAAAPGTGEALVDGKPVAVEVLVVDIPAATKEPEQRSPAEVKQVQAAANDLVTQLNDLLVEGEKAQVAVRETSTGAELVGIAEIPVPVEDVAAVKTPESAVLVAGTDSTGEKLAETNQGGILEIVDGGQVATVAYGLTPGVTGELYVLSTPVLLDKFTVGSSGSFRRQTKLPATLGAGDHTIVVATPKLTVSLGLKVRERELPTRSSKVWSKLPAKIGVSTFVTLLSADQAASRRITSLTPVVCLGAKFDVVLINEGRCTIQIKDAKSGKVLRSMTTLVGPKTKGAPAVGGRVNELKPILFETGTTGLRAPALVTIKAAKKAMSDATSILVVGHSGGALGNTLNNQRLSIDRATWVRQLLVKGGIRTQISTYGLGALDPVTEMVYEFAQRTNRRVAVYLIP